LNLYYIPPGKTGWIGETGHMAGKYPGKGGAMQVWFPDASDIIWIQHLPNWFIP